MDKLPEEIFRKIFESLHLQDQLNIAEVCVFFHKLIEKLIQKKYKEIEVFEIEESYVVSNKLHQRIKKSKFPQFLETPKCCLLKREDFIKFLMINCSNVKTLSLVLDNKYSEYNYLREIQFKNVLHLYYEGRRIAQNDYMQWFNLSFPNLEGLCLKNCPVEETFSVSDFTNMSNLKMLTIENKSKWGINYHAIKSLLANEKLETLALDIAISNFSGKERADSDANFSHNLQNLTIGIIEDVNIFLDFNNNILKNLNNLRNLTLITTIFITDTFFTTLNTACIHLESLSLQNCTIKKFIPVSSLKSLEFQNCDGLRWQDFRNILTQKNLKSFTSLDSRYMGEFQYFNINPSLEHINLHYNIPNKINDLFRLNENRLESLSSLQWSVDFTEQLWLNPINCPNLETLNVRTENILIENLMEFKSLKYLSLDIGEHFELLDLIKILRHPSLKILSCNLAGFSKNDRDRLAHEFRNLKSGIKKLNLYFVLGISFEQIDPWINLLHKNKKLTLRLEDSNPVINIDFVMKICDKATFRKVLNISLSGLNIENVYESIDFVSISEIMEWRQMKQFITLENITN